MKDGNICNVNVIDLIKKVSKKVDI